MSNFKECGITGKKYTYGGVIDRALRWGTVLNKLLPPPATSPGQRNIVYFSPNCPEFPIVFYGTQAVGATIICMNHTYTVAEVSRELNDCDASAIVADPKYEQILRSAFQNMNKTLPVFTIGFSDYGSPNLLEIIEDSNTQFAELVESPPESIGAMFYSSGTTGKPKGVALSHRALTSNCAIFLQPDIFAYKPTTAEYQETVTAVLPFYHVYGAVVINMFSFYLGAKMVSLPIFTPQDFLRIIKDHKMEIVHLVPPMLNFLVNSPAVTSKELETVKVFMCAAAPVPPPSAMALKEKAPHPVLFQEGKSFTEWEYLAPLLD
ncbi:hypothetical protein SK128_003931 [Halocaridina rubra]|uniref:AMP-dependent synthetase/ligase domain-containing protein n=1 Tax=Halocaridina rubra TaxID=373956 RepID=A0AAN8XV65_HALRR